MLQGIREIREVFSGVGPSMTRKALSRKGGGVQNKTDATMSSELRKNSNHGTVRVPPEARDTEVSRHQ